VSLDFPKSLPFRSATHSSSSQQDSPYPDAFEPSALSVASSTC
jgi:hypothetical protein